MTTKITSLAMFAIAAFAIGGMMVTPAFAAWNPTIYTATWGVPTGTTYDGPEVERDCAGQTDKCGAQLIVRNTSVDFIWNYYKIGGAGVECDVNFVTELDGVEVMDTTFNDHTTYGQWKYVSIYVPGGIDPSDSIETTTSFTDCHT